MKRIRVKKEYHKGFFDTKGKMIRGGIITAIVVILMAVFIIIESAQGKLVIQNNTDLKLEYVKSYFVDAEGPMNEGIRFEDVASYQSVSAILDRHDLLNAEANYEIRFKFENYDPMFVDAGYFNDTFRGSIKVDFERSGEDNLILKVNAKNGLLPTKLIDCDEEFMIRLSDGYVEE